MQFNKEIFNNLIPILKNKGLTESAYFEHNGGLDFYTLNEVSDYRLTLDLDISKKGFVNIYGRVSFINVISILSKFTDFKPNVYEAIVINYDLYKDKQNWNNIHKRFTTFPLKTALDIKGFEKEITSHIDTYILPFFEKFPNLQSVNDKILNSFPKEEYANYIPGQTNFKALIIMKLCNNPKYVDFKEWTLTAYKKGVEINSARYGKDYEVLKLLVDYLDNIVSTHPTP